MQKPQEIITSRQNPLLVLTAKLADRKHRDREGLFRFDGKKLFLEAIDAVLPLTAVLFRESSEAALRAAAGERMLPRGCRAAILPDALFDRISEERSPEGVICLSHRLTAIHKTVTAKEWEGELPTSRILFLESVRDPGNLGTIIRSARAFGADLLVLSDDCADIYNPRTIRAAMGTLFRQPIRITPTLEEVIAAHGRHGRTFAATLDEGSLRLGSVSLRAGDAVVVGNEGHGLSAAVINACTDRIYIPMADGVESLNAGVAASVLLWELQRDGRVTQ